MPSKVRVFCPQCGADQMYEGDKNWVATKEKLMCPKCRFQGNFSRKRPKLEQESQILDENEE